MSAADRKDSASGASLPETERQPADELGMLTAQRLLGESPSGDLATVIESAAFLLYTCQRSKKGYRLRAFLVKLLLQLGCFAFTFDDGPVADDIASIGARATFFVVGNMGKCIYDEDSVQALSRPAIDQQVQLVEEALFKILGVVPACIRPPYGSASPSTIQYLNQKYRSLHAPQNVIIFNHETVPTTSNQVIPQALQIVRQNGYHPRNMGTVAQTVGFAPYKVIGRPGVRDSSWTCAGKPGGGGW
ncbi:unnamed protein product [Tilletia controversa]|nr:unnamed protein product [Tilletia controversa]